MRRQDTAELDRCKLFRSSVFIAQVSLYSHSLSVAIAQNTYGTYSEIKALRELLDEVELSSLQVQADALHANRHLLPIS